jgi:hypothetical protein
MDSLLKEMLEQGRAVPLAKEQGELRERVVQVREEREEKNPLVRGGGAQRMGMGFWEGVYGGSAGFGG